ncbi:hypothetical protein [Undibacterium pigrum]|uniref:Aromatic-ring opening dioxygenase LigAB LigA subunit n=1 Tax=Undibacterium pigrum TaxID=401470 RepID=A0A318J781_9BURK|nr:hypothetical protein [Undibacterium pigrum]PXX39758.1 aromatic-ring opening dioxygenase LigAB LigA subunit [Undibacterium pigrum]
MSKLLEYLNTLDKDAAAREAHAKDPNGAMQSFGLNDDEQTALLSRDKQTVADSLGISAEELPAIDSVESPY